MRGWSPSSSAMSSSDESSGDDVKAPPMTRRKGEGSGGWGRRAGSPVQRRKRSRSSNSSLSDSVSPSPPPVKVTHMHATCMPHSLACWQKHKKKHSSESPPHGRKGRSSGSPPHERKGREHKKHSKKSKKHSKSKRKRKVCVISQQCQHHVTLFGNFCVQYSGSSEEKRSGVSKKEKELRERALESLKKKPKSRCH